MYTEYFIKILFCLIITTSVWEQGIGQDVEDQRATIIDQIASSKGENKVERMIDLAYYYLDFVPDSTLYYSQAALKEAQKIKYLKGELSIEVLEGSYYRSTGLYAESISRYKRALEICAIIKNDSYHAKIQDNLANVYEEMGDLDKAWEISQEAYLFFLTTKDSAAIFNSAVGIGNIYVRLKDYTQAIDLFNTSLVHSKTNLEKAIVCGNLALSYKGLGDISEALDWYSKSLSYGKDLPLFRAEALLNVALLNKELKNFDQAITKLNEVIELAEFTKNDNHVYVAQMALANIFLDKKEIDKCKKLVEQLSISQPVQLSTYQQLDFLNLQKRLALETHDYKSALWLTDSIEVKSKSIKSDQLEKDLLDFKTKYNVIQKEVKIEQQAYELDKNKTRQARLMYLLIGSLLILSMLIWFFFYRQKINKILNENLKKVQEEKISRLENVRRLITIQAIHTGQEEERLRIARDLHDSLGSLITNLKIHASKGNGESLNERHIETENKMNQLIDEVGREVRRITNNIAPAALNDYGLNECIKDLVVSLSVDNIININYQWIGPELTYQKDRDLIIYRVIQEIVNNAVKHSNSNEVDLQISSLGQILQIIYEDNGSGFDSDQETNKGHGLKNMVSRVEFLAGQIEINSRPNNGTVIDITIPIDENT